MIVSMFTVTIPPQAKEGFERSWQQRAHQVDSMPGFRGLEVLRDGNTSGRYLVVTRWDTREDFDQWVNSPEFMGAHARGTGDAQGGGIAFYEVLPS